MNEIDQLKFSILPHEFIKKTAVCEVTSPSLQVIHKKKKKDPTGTLYDPRMGPTDNVECITCGYTPKTCPGHFGYIEMNCIVIHPLYTRQVVNFLKCICIRCSRLVVHPEYFDLLFIPLKNRFKHLVKTNIPVCYYCTTAQPKYTLKDGDTVIMTVSNEKSELTVAEIYTLFEIVSQNDLDSLGVETHPKHLFIRYLPILPPRSRMFVLNDGEVCDDDLTVIYSDIIKNNNALKKKNQSKTVWEKHVSTILFRIRTLFDNNSGKAKHSNDRKMLGIKERISGKEGQIRKSIQGKRTNFSARTVIGPDTTLKLDEIAIPVEFSENLSFPEVVNDFNRDSIQELVNQRKANVLERGTKRIYIKYIRNPAAFKKICTLQMGDIVHRHLQDGDVVLLNRQPTLHKGSMLAFKVKIRPGKTIRMNLAITSTFNADFDGDEMNIHVPQSYRARAELVELSGIRKNIIGGQMSQSLLNIIQDALLGTYLLTKDDTPIPRDVFFNMLMPCELPYPNLIEELDRIQKVYTFFGKDIPLYSGKTLFSLLLPRTFNHQVRNKTIGNHPTTSIHNGVLYEGAINKVHIKKGHQSLVTLLYHEYSEDTCYHFVNNVQFLANQFLLYRGFTIGIGDCVIPAEISLQIEQQIEKCFLKTHVIESTTSNPLVRETKINWSLGNTRDIGMRMAKESLDLNNNFLDTVVSGSKGDFFNITQIMGLLGQQNISGGRVECHLKNDRTLHYFKDTSSYESRGFIKNSFLKGLNPSEYWFHAMSGREGITDTALKTASSGYIERKMVKVMEDIEIKYDYTTRNAKNRIVQFMYGCGNLSSEKTQVNKDRIELINIDRTVQILNEESKMKS